MAQCTGCIYTHSTHWRHTSSLDRPQTASSFASVFAPRAGRAQHQCKRSHKHNAAGTSSPRAPAQSWHHIERTRCYDLERQLHSVTWGRCTQRVTSARTNVSANVHGGESGGLQCSCYEQLGSLDSAECFGRGGRTVAKFLPSCCRRCSPTGVVVSTPQAYPEVPDAGSAVDRMLHSGEHAVHATC